MTRRLLQISVGLLLGLTVTTLLLYPTVRDERTRLREAEMGFLPAPLPSPAFRLTTHRGEPFASDALRGRFAFVFFGFTHCPDVCPVTLRTLTGALESIPGGSERLQGVMITVDPARDTPEQLARYMERFDPSLLALTGREEEIRAAAEGFGVFFRVSPGAEAAETNGGHGVAEAGGERRAAEAGGETQAAEAAGGERAAQAHGEHGAAGGAYLVDHTARSYVLDPAGDIVLTLPPFVSREEMTEALTHLLRTR